MGPTVAHTDLCEPYKQLYVHVPENFFVYSSFILTGGGENFSYLRPQLLPRAILFKWVERKLGLIRSHNDPICQCGRYRYRYPLEVRHSRHATEDQTSATGWDRWKAPSRWFGSCLCSLSQTHCFNSHSFAAQARPSFIFFPSSHFMLPVCPHSLHL